VDEREEFCRLAMQPGANMRALCQSFAIARSNGYKWLGRYKTAGRAGLEDRSRRPHRSPHHSDASTEAEVLRIRAESNNAWGARKIAKVMERDGRGPAPALSTITAILRRHGKLEEHRDEHPGPFVRFERAAPNELWQMDYKGHFAIDRGPRCHPLTVLDDHSRFSVGLQACLDEQEETVCERLTTIFRRYGLPLAMLMDNGSPWGNSTGGPFSGLAVWLMRLGIHVCHGRPHHPQTQGKEERFHRTLKAEVLNGHSFRDVAECQQAFDKWRQVYNYERPHDALNLETPSTRYSPSSRSFPEQLPKIEYWPGDIVRKADSQGFVSVKGVYCRIGRPFRGQHIALRSTEADGLFDAFFCSHHLGAVDLRQAAHGFVDIEESMSTTPQAQQQQRESSSKRR
jgi:transposase InsO family protein